MEWEDGWGCVFVLTRFGPSLGLFYWSNLINERYSDYVDFYPPTPRQATPWHPTHDSGRPMRLFWSVGTLPWLRSNRLTCDKPKLQVTSHQNCWQDAQEISRFPNPPFTHTCIRSTSRTPVWHMFWHTEPGGVDKMSNIFADDIFINFLYEICTFIKISLNLCVVVLCIDNKSVLVLVMAWRRAGDKPLPEPMVSPWRIMAYLASSTWWDAVVNFNWHWNWNAFTLFDRHTHMYWRLIDHWKGLRVTVIDCLIATGDDEGCRRDSLQQFQ